MTYKKILRQLAIKENISVKEIENQMDAAIISAGLSCSAKEFIAVTSKLIRKKTIYSNIA